jgi:hypothetical protein
VRRVTVTIILVVLGSLIAATAEAKVIARSVYSGSHASMSGFEYFIEAPASLAYDVTAKPSTDVDVQVVVSCSRGFLAPYLPYRRTYRRSFIATNAIHRGVRLPIKRPDDCYFAVSATYADTKQSGRIVSQLRATFRRG